MKKIIALLLIISMVVLSSCNNNTTGDFDDQERTNEDSNSGMEYVKPTIIAIAASGNADGTLLGIVSKKYFEDINEISGGKLDIQFFDDGQLGGDMEILEGVRLGSIDIHVGSPSTLVNLIPELAILDINGLYSDVETCNEVLNGEFFDMLQKYYNEKGLQLLNIYSTTFRQTVSDIPIKSVSDLDGLKIRTMENNYHTAFWEELGADPTPLSFSELYIALQQGIVNSAEGPLSTSIIPMKLAELEHYLILTNHIPNITTTTMNKEKWDSLSNENQKYLTDMFNGIVDELIKGQSEDDERLIQLCKSRYKMEVIIPDQDLKDAIKSSSNKVIELMKQNINSDFVDTYLSDVERVESNKSQ
jgi:tripartite ATP-independent transporter DctP family solute receptor